MHPKTVCPHQVTQVTLGWAAGGRPMVSSLHNNTSPFFLMLSNIMWHYMHSYTLYGAEVSSTIFQSLLVTQSVRHPWHLSRSPLCAIYKGIDALYWPSIMKYQMPTPHSVLYILTQYTASSFRNAELSQLDLVIILQFTKHMYGKEKITIRNKNEMFQRKLQVAAL